MSVLLHPPQNQPSPNELSPVPDKAVQAPANMRQLAALAIDTIRQIMEDPKTPPSVRLRACLAVLDHRLFPDAKCAAAPPPKTPPAVLPATAAAVPLVHMSRNAPCPCGSGNKLKHCCGTNAPPALYRSSAGQPPNSGPPGALA